MTTNVGITKLETEKRKLIIRVSSITSKGPDSMVIESETGARYEIFKKYFLASFWSIIEPGAIIHYETGKWVRIIRVIRAESPKVFTGESIPADGYLCVCDICGWEKTIDLITIDYQILSEKLLEIGKEHEKARPSCESLNLPLKFPHKPYKFHIVSSDTADNPEAVKRLAELMSRKELV